MEMDTTVVDTESTSTTTTSEADAQAAFGKEMLEQEEGTTAQPTQEERAEARKWKLKIHGEEQEYSEDEVIKYAQLGKAGQRAMEEAAALKKKQREIHSQLQSTAEKDVFLLYQVLTGKKHPLADQAAQKATAQGEGENHDPRDIELRETRAELAEIKHRLEQEDISRARKEIETELSDAVKKYPALDSPYLKSYVKSEYKRALTNGLDMSLEDIAFYVAQDVKRQEAQKRKATEQKLEANKQKAPVITGPTGEGAKKKGTLEDSLKLGGLMPS